MNIAASAVHKIALIAEMVPQGNSLSEKCAIIKSHFASASCFQSSSCLTTVIVSPTGALACIGFVMGGSIYEI